MIVSHYDNADGYSPTGKSTHAPVNLGNENFDQSSKFEDIITTSIPNTAKPTENTTTTTTKSTNNSHQDGIRK
jgi:hypothetical protein